VVAIGGNVTGSTITGAPRPTRIARRNQMRRLVMKRCVLHCNIGLVLPRVRIQLSMLSRLDRTQVGSRLAVASVAPQSISAFLKKVDGPLAARAQRRCR